MGCRRAQFRDGIGHGHAVGGEGQEAHIIQAVAKSDGVLRYDANTRSQTGKRLTLGGSRRLCLQKIGLAHGKGSPAQEALVGNGH